MRRIILFLIFGLVLVISGYVYWNYYKEYSTGIRSGHLRKFSRKGDVFKTYEGELVQDNCNAGMAFNAPVFYFSVTDENVAAYLEKHPTTCVQLHYVQYRRTLAWRGDNYDGRNDTKGQYIIVRADSLR